MSTTPGQDREFSEDDLTGTRISRNVHMALFRGGAGGGDCRGAVLQVRDGAARVGLRPVR